MPIRHHAQRKHIIHSLNSLLYQLHTLSFFLAPSIIAYLCRCGTQFQFAKPRDLDGKRSLRFWFVIILLVNMGSVWSHATEGAPEGKTIVLDFVGMGRKPSKAQLLWLDFTIILLECILSTIAFETSLANAMPDDTPDPLYIPPTTETIFDSEEHDLEHDALLPITSLDTESTPLNSDPSFSYPPKPPSTDTRHLPPREPVMILTLSHVYHRLVSPTPIPPPRSLDLESLEDSLRRLALPLPATSGASMAVSRMLELIRRARAREIERTSRGATASGAAGGPGATSGSSSGSGRSRRSNSRRIPGAIIEEEDDGD
ncbi:hypothetical protein SCHPADRAFT_871150 [Schizopora paradoxa]|uniref:DUF1746 domain-containing protein n=1 Tax=Schizopora paradoxa TaxID=27342 RepID=A0A0H2RUW3_9AGAM|nr:hypothetical protein SCHPADRAFT_871150 [Schizopora paradoxa]